MERRHGYDVLNDSKDEVALTSRWPARVVLLATWQRSGGPSSRNVADGIAMRCAWKWAEEPSDAHQGPQFVR